MVSAAAGNGVSMATNGWRPWLLAGLCALLVFAGEQILETFEKRTLLERERSLVVGELAQIRERLDSVINGNLLAIHGLTAVIAAQPDINQDAFSRIARGLVTAQRPLRNIAAAPGMVVSLMYPIEGNEAAIGLDYRSHPTQRQAAMRAVEEGQPVVAGPLTLVQGGAALIIRAPVFLPSGVPDGGRRVWGLVSAVLDLDRFYHLAGLPADAHNARLALAIRGEGDNGTWADAFYGDPTIFSSDPVSIEISLPGTRWQVAALPAAGWGSYSPDHYLLLTRIGGFVLALLLAAMAYLLTRSYQDLGRASARLRESQALFQGFMDNLPAGAFIRQPNNGDILFENRWLRETLAGQHDDCGIGAEHDLAALASRPQLIHHQMQDRRGTLLYCDTLRFVLSDTGANPLIGGVVMDVTDRAIAQMDLANNRARLRSLLNTIPDMVWLKDPEGMYLACNPRFEDFFGVPEAEIVGKRDHDFVAADLADSFRARDLAAIAAGGPVTNEEKVTFASDGHLELLETTKAPVMDQHGGLLGVLGIARDITERKRAQDQLEKQRRLLSDSQRIAHIGSWEIDLDSRVRTWSDETYRIYGVDPETFANTFENFFALIHPDDRPAIRAWVDALFALQQPGELEMRIVRPDGQTRIVSGRGTVEFDSTGRPTRAWGTAQDITERKQDEQELRRQKAVLDRTGRLAKVGGWEFDVASGTGSWSDETAQIHGLAPSSVATVAQGLSFFQGESLKRIQDALDRAIAQAIPYDLVLELHAADGTQKWVRTIAEPVVDDGGKVVRVVGAIQDISTQRQAELALAAKQREASLLAGLIERSSQPLAVGFGDGRLSRFNRAFLDLLGYDLEEMTRINWTTDLTPEQWNELEAQVLAELSRTHLPVRYEKEYIRKDGTIVPVELYAHIAQDSPDGPPYYFAFVTDITERKRAERVLAESESRLKEAQRLAHVGSWQIDHQCGGMQWSDEVYRILDIEQSDTAPSFDALLSVVHPDDLELVRETFARAVADHHPHELVHRLQTARGQIKFVEQRIETLYSENGVALRSLGTMQDITTRKHAEQEIQKLNEELEDRVQLRTRELESANRELETFTYSVSHDLKAPLRGIDGYSRLLIEDHFDRLDDEGRLFLQNVRAGVTQMSQLIEDLLAYSRMERRGMLETQVDLTKLVGGILDERREELASCAAIAKMELDVQTARGDPNGLALVLRNLIDNAIKFSRDSKPPVIVISAYLQDSAIIFEVKDNGIGFDMRFHDRIFDIFQRLQRAEDYPGTGIGLAIVRKAMQRMNGRVWAESVPDHGASFFAELPQ